MEWEDASQIAAFPAEATPFAPLIVAPDTDLERVVRRITSTFDLSVELSPWLRAGEDTLWRLDDLLK